MGEALLRSDESAARRRRLDVDAVGEHPHQVQAEPAVPEAAVLILARLSDGREALRIETLPMIHHLQHHMAVVVFQDHLEAAHFRARMAGDV